ncbi:MAG TPA: pyridoxal-phosphate dependent enzyme [Solirubrobacteraceae bacterium]|jgi:threonine dehydratase|nr:pyridoxal-phosphate dependent enzyme [Solirubrobacteraceae bacterium]
MARAAPALTAERDQATDALARAGLLRTPLIDSPSLSERYGCEVRLKLECHQLTGSFKARGAVAAVSCVPDAQTVVTASAGNHALGIAFACFALGRTAEIFIPRGTDQAKVDALARFGPGIRTRVVDGSYDDTELAARQAAGRPGTTFVSSYNDPLVVAGQSTVGTEALAQWPQADAVIVPVGGGGLLSGVALACADHHAPVAAWGVEPESSPAMSASLENGRIVRIVESVTSAAQGLIGNLDPDSITFALVRAHSAGVIVSSEEEILGAVARIYADHAIVVEPSGGAALCGLGRVSASGARRIVCVLTGSNVAAASHFEIVSQRQPVRQSGKLAPDGESMIS